MQDFYEKKLFLCYNIVNKKGGDFVYISPFEKKRKQLEEKEKTKIKDEQIYEEYTKLRSDIGFDENDEALPGFIKNYLINTKKDKFESNKIQEQKHENLYKQILYDDNHNSQEPIKKEQAQKKISPSPGPTTYLKEEKSLNNLSTENHYLENLADRDILKYSSEVFADLVNTNRLVDQFYGIIETSANSSNVLDDLLNLLSKNQCYIITAENIFKYSYPEMFFLKQIIRSLPLIKLEDKIVLWKKALICLSVTEYGRTDCSIHEVIDEIGITYPLKIIREELNKALRAYNLDKISLLIVIKNISNVRLSNVIRILEFITDVFTGVYTLKFVFHLNEEMLNQFKSFQLSYDSLMNLDGLITKTNHDKLRIKQDNYDTSLNNNNRVNFDEPINSKPTTSYETRDYDRNYNNPTLNHQNKNIQINNFSNKQSFLNDDFRIRVDLNLKKHEESRREFAEMENKKANARVSEIKFNPEILDD